MNIVANVLKMNIHLVLAKKCNDHLKLINALVPQINFNKSD
jgi:hypothetical protein